MRSTILSVGTEILFGEIVNTNTVFLSQQLQQLGIDVMYHHTVGDNSGRLADLIKLCFEDCDLVITTGGLGPTQDDLTKETACRVLGDELVLHQPSMDALEARFQKFGRPMTENNRKQAYLPSKSTAFPNDCGTAPGFALEVDGKCIICLPGPPHEMKDMWEKQAKPFLEKKADAVIFSKMIRTFGIGESALETAILDLVDGQTDPTLATYAKNGQCSLRIASKRKTREEAEAAVAEMLVKVQERVGEYIYSTEDEELFDVLGKKLLENNISIACAESCTGGLFAGGLTDIPGISQVFDRGIVTYTNRAKMEELGVKGETLETYDAVSEQTAKEMAAGLQKKTGCRLCLSVTGNAGPGGGTEERPVGLMFIGAAFDGKLVCRRLDPRGRDRSGNRRWAVLNMCELALRLLEGRE